MFDKRHNLKRIDLLAWLFTVAILILSAWSTWSYMRLPCHGSRLGSWRPAVTDFSGTKLTWAFRLNERASAPGFASCLRASGYRLTMVNLGVGDNYLAVKGKQRISNSDGFGNVDQTRFYVW
jgi:hypothetical protein